MNSEQEILQMSDEVFRQTLAYRAYGSKKLFIQKIKDPTIRQKMLRIR